MTTVTGIRAKRLNALPPDHNNLWKIYAVDSLKNDTEIVNRDFLRVFYSLDLFFPLCFRLGHFSHSH